MKKLITIVTLFGGIITIIIFISGHEHLPDFFKNTTTPINKNQVTNINLSKDNEVSKGTNIEENNIEKKEEKLYVKTPDAIWPGQTFIDDYSGVTFGLIEITGEFNKAHYAKIKLTLPDREESIVKDDVTTGDSWKYRNNGKSYRIIFTYVHPAFCEIQIREERN